MCVTNASEKSHFRSVKHRRLSGRRRVHPHQLVAAELEYVNGKLNQLKLPKLTTKRRKDVSEKEEHWGARKHHATYTDPSHAAKLLKNMTQSRNRLPHRLFRREPADTEIHRIHDTLQRSFPQYDGLAEPGLGQCVRAVHCRGFRPCVCHVCLCVIRRQSIPCCSDEKRNKKAQLTQREARDSLGI